MTGNGLKRRSTYLGPIVCFFFFLLFHTFFLATNYDNLDTSDVTATQEMRKDDHNGRTTGNDEENGPKRR